MDSKTFRIAVLFPWELACALKIIAVKSNKRVSELVIRSVCNQYRSALERQLGCSVDDLLKEKYN